MGQDFYGITPAMSVTAPMLLRAYYTSIARTEITLEFDQDMSWSSFSKPNYYLDKVGSKVASGNEDPVNKKLIKLQLSSAGTATSTLDYLEDDHWSYGEAVSSLLYGVNAIPALTFADVIIAPPGPTGLTATPGDGQVALSWSASGGATGYNVKRSTSNGGPYTLIGSSVSTGYTDMSAANGTTYYYVVSATVSASGSTGESPDSTQATALPLSSAKDILTFEFPGLPATTITGTNISVSVPFGTPVTALVPNITISPLAALAPLSGVANNFTSPQSYTVTAQNLSTKSYTVTVTVGTSAPFTAWAHDPAQGLTAGLNDGLMDDPDHDGIPNLLEFALGGHPMTAARSILPVLTKLGGVWYFEYERSDAAQSSTTQAVEYGNNLTGWTALAIPATTGGAVTITPGTPSDHVKVSIPDPGANGFVRLRVTTP